MSKPNVNAVLFNLNDELEPDSQISEFLVSGITGDWVAKREVEYVGLAHAGQVLAVGEFVSSTPAHDGRMVVQCKQMSRMQQDYPLVVCQNPVRYANFDPVSRQFS